jgi:hypothetical protein
MIAPNRPSSDALQAKSEAKQIVVAIDPIIDAAAFYAAPPFVLRLGLCCCGHAVLSTSVSGGVIHLRVIDLRVASHAPTRHALLIIDPRR